MQLYGKGTKHTATVDEALSEIGGEGAIPSPSIVSLILGVLTLILIWLPVMQLVPGLIAACLGLIGLRASRRCSTAGMGIALTGIVCALAGMWPTVAIALAILRGEDVSRKDVYVQTHQKLVQQERSNLPTEATVNIVPSTRADGLEAYKVNQYGPRSANWKVNSGGEAMHEQPLFFSFKSFPSGRVRYDGTLHVVAPKQLELQLELTSEVPFQLTVEGLGNIVASEDGQVLDLQTPLTAGKHSIRISGNAR